MLTRDVALPLHAQLETTIAGEIDDGLWSAGQSLPTEAQLCATHGVSRITVRRALDSLAKRGLVTRRHGIGTFVADHRPGVRTVTTSGSLDDYLAGEERFELTVLSFGEVDPSAQVRRGLKLGNDDRAVRLEVVSGHPGVPTLYVQLFFSEAVGRRFTPSDLTPGSTVIGMLQRKLGVRVVRATQQISATCVGDIAGRHLNLSPDTPVLFIERIHHIADGTPLELVLIHHHPERYEYRNELLASVSG